MKILFLPNWRVTHASQPDLSKQSPDIVVDGERYWFFKHWNTDNLEVSIIDIGSLGKLEKIIFNIYIVQAIRAFLKSKEFDIIIAHGGQSALLLSLLRRIFPRRHTPFILIDVGSITGGREQKYLIKLFQFLSKGIDHVIFHSSFQKFFYKKHFHNFYNNSTFIPFGVDTNYFRPPEELNKSGRYILSFGYKFRDWETLLNAYRKSSIDSKLLIISPENIDAISSDNVIVHQAMPINVLITLIKNSKFVVIPLTDKKYAHGQMSILQTMALGKPVITSYSGAITDYLQHDKNSLLYPLGDSDTLAKLISEFDSNPMLRKRIAEQGILSINKCFNEEAMGQQIFQVAQSLLKQ